MYHMTRRNVSLEKIQVETEKEFLLLSTMWREDNNVFVLGFVVSGCYENDSVQKQRHVTCGQRLGFGT